MCFFVRVYNTILLASRLARTNGGLLVRLLRGCQSQVHDGLATGGDMHVVASIYASTVGTIGARQGGRSSRGVILLGRILLALSSILGRTLRAGGTGCDGSIEEQ